AVGPRAPEAGLEVLVAAEARRAVREIGARGPTPASERIARRAEHAEGGLGEDVPLQADHAHLRVLQWQVLDRARAHQQAADIRVPDAALDLAAAPDRDLHALVFTRGRQGADGAAVERQQVRVLDVGAHAELEDVGAVEEELALLREQDVEPRQVRLPLIDLGLGEVGVDREHAVQVGPELLGDVQAHVALRVTALAWIFHHEVAHVRRLDRQADALVERGQALELAGDTHLEDLEVELRSGPAARLLDLLDVALEIHAPAVETLLVAQALDRDADLAAPAVGNARGLHFPHRVPRAVHVQALGGDDPVELGPQRIDREHEARALVAERVEHDHDVILLVQLDVPGLGHRVHQ